MKKNNRFFSFLFIIIGLVLTISESCKKEEKAQLPILTTTNVKDIIRTTATCGGDISSDGGASVTSRGNCWSKLENPTIADSITRDGTGTGVFTSLIEGLNPNTTYYVRAYATNRIGTAYGNQVSLTTTNDFPTITTTTISNITQRTATSGGNITFDGGASVSARGICWSKLENPTIADSISIDGIGSGVFISSMADLSANTTYYVRAYATNSAGTGYGNVISFTTLPPVPPSITTSDEYNIAIFSATCGGNVTFDGGSIVTARGVCWGTSPNPTVTNFHSSDGTGLGLFTSTISELVASTTYYMRAYATNSIGTSYGVEKSFTTFDINAIHDEEGNYYNIVTIGTQVWMKDNLRATKYRNGVPIPMVTDNSTWVYQNSGTYCWYNNETSSKYRDGALYNFYALVDSQNPCPIGWHVPTDAEWSILADYLINNGYGYQGSGSDIGKSLAASSGWATNSIAGNVGNDQASNNNSNFTAFPGGYRGNMEGSFNWVGNGSYWWSSTESSSGIAWIRILLYDNSDFLRSQNYEFSGFSIRCIKD